MLPRQVDTDSFYIANWLNSWSIIPYHPWYILVKNCRRNLWPLALEYVENPWGSFLDPSTNSGMSHRIPHGWYTNGYSKWCMYTQTGYGIPNGVWQMVHKWYTNGVCADAYRLGLNENDASAQVWHDLPRGYRFLGRSHRLPHVCTVSENQCPSSTYFLVLEFVRWLIFIYNHIYIHTHIFISTILYIYYYYCTAHFSRSDISFEYKPDQPLSLASLWAPALEASSYCWLLSPEVASGRTGAKRSPELSKKSGRFAQWPQGYHMDLYGM